MAVLGVILLHLLTGIVRAEDERSFVGASSMLPLSPKKVKFEHPFPKYLLDLNGDGKKEQIHFINRDGLDWMHIVDFRGNSIYRYVFRASGLDATPYKMRFRNLGPTSKVLVIHYYEGYTDYLKFMGTARLHFLTFEKNDLKTLRMHRGPGVFYEHFEKGNSYRQRTHKVDIVDWNRDGLRDIVVGYGGFRIRDIFLYRGQGNWLHLTQPLRSVKRWEGF